MCGGSMGLKEDLKKNEFDVRLVNWNTRLRTTDTQKLNEHLTKLDDVSGNAEYVKFENTSDEEVVQH